MFQLLRKYIDSQYGNPRGILGWRIGQKMMKQHLPETQWTVSRIDIRPDDTVLELGCGAGKGLQLVADLVTTGNVIGLDQSKTLVKSALNRNHKRVATGVVKVIHGDAQEIPLAESSVDKVFSIHSIYFWDDLNTAMSEVSRVLRPGGTVIFTLSDVLTLGLMQFVLVGCAGNTGNTSYSTQPSYAYEVEWNYQIYGVGDTIKQVGRQIGTVKHFDSNPQDPILNNGSNFFSVGTKLFSIPGKDPQQAIAGEIQRTYYECTAAP